MNKIFLYKFANISEQNLGSKSKVLQENKDGTQLTYDQFAGTGLNATLVNDSINDNLKRQGIFSDTTKANFSDKIVKAPLKNEQEPKYNHKTNTISLPYINREKETRTHDLPENFLSVLESLNFNNYPSNLRLIQGVHEIPHFIHSQKGDTSLERQKALRRVAATEKDKKLHKDIKSRDYDTATTASNMLYGYPALANAVSDKTIQTARQNIINGVKKDYKWLQQQLDNITHKDTNRSYPEDLPLDTFDKTVANYARSRLLRDYGKDNVDIQPHYGDSWMYDDYLDSITEDVAHNQNLRNGLFRWKPYRQNDKNPFNIIKETADRYDAFMKLSDQQITDMFTNGELSLEDYDALMRGRKQYKNRLEKGGQEAVDNYKNIILPLSYNLNNKTTNKKPTTYIV